MNDALRRRPGCRLALALLLLASPGLALSGGVGVADAAAGTWTPALQMRFREVTSTAVSPDGARVAFVVREAVMEGERSEYLDQVWLARTDGSDVRQLTWRDQSSRDPAFSPDGRTLAFLSQKPGAKDDGDAPRTQIWAMPVDGGEARELSAAASGVTAFAWSPAGDAIAWLAPDPETEEEKQARKEKRWVEVVDQGVHLSRLWVSPFEAAAGRLGDPRQLGEEADVHVTELDWSPDGSRIVVGHQADPSLNTGTIAGDLSIVDVATGTRTPLVSRVGRDAQPRFSSDGRRVAFVSHGGSLERIGLGDVYLVEAAGGAPDALAHTPDRNATLVGWTTTGGLLVSESWHTGRGLYVLPADGSPPRRLDADTGPIGAPSISSGSDVAAFTLEDADTPEDVFTARLSSFAPMALSDLHEDVERPPLGRTEKIEWSSSDGTVIEGLLTYPVGHRPGERVPLVLQIHGGPAGVFRDTFTGSPATYMVQTFAQRGYAILRPNPRGSTGYGRDFRYANVRDWCRGDYDDVMSGVDAVVDSGVADPERLYVMGWSYGGYMTSCVVSRTDRFRAASMGAGLPDLVSMVHTTDIPDYLVAHMGGRELWEDYEVYMRHSAMFRLEEIVTPTQILHGEKDVRVPLSQGQEFYGALRRRGVATELAVYPRTPHGPREPRLMMDVTARILAWFERFPPGEEPAGSGGR